MCTYLAFEGAQTTTLMYKYYTFKGAPTPTLMCEYVDFKGTHNSNCNVYVLCFLRSLTTISNVQMKKIFQPTSTTKKLWVKTSSKKFWKDPNK